MSWSASFVWIAIALLLGLAELTSGALVLLALAIAAGLTAAVAAAGGGLVWQLVAMGAFSGLFVPIAIWKVGPRFSPRGSDYGTTGTGVEKGVIYTTERRGFDGSPCIKVNGDLYPAKEEQGDGSQLPVGIEVVFDRFDGTTAIVHQAGNTRNAGNDKES